MQPVKVTGRAGTVLADVLDVRQVDQLPAIAGLDDERAKQILTSWCIVRVAFIEHWCNFNGTRNRVGFIALQDDHARWWDLRGNQLQIDPEV